MKNLNLSNKLNLSKSRKNISLFITYTSFIVKKRNQLNNFLRSNKIDSKIHYPKPLHLHDAAKKFKYNKGG